MKRDENEALSMNYAEYTCAVKCEGKLLLKRIILILFFLALFVVGTAAVCGWIIYAPTLELIVIGVCGVGYFFASSRLKIEYEYIIASAQVEFDAIYGARTRKEIFTISLDEVERIAPYNSDTAKYIESKNVSKSYDFCSSKKSKRRYFMLVRKDRSNFVIYFDAVARTLDVLKFFRSAIVEIDKEIYDM